MQRISTIFLTSFLFVTLSTNAQLRKHHKKDADSDTLIAVKVDKKIFTNNQEDIRVLTRSAIEQRLYNGLVVSDLEHVSLIIGGFIQADIIQSFNENTSPLAFSPASIVVPSQSLSNTVYNISASRLFFNGIVKVDENAFNTLIEWDFFNDNNLPNLRLVYASYKNIGFGKYWSNLTDLGAYPNTLDYFSAPAMNYSRQVQFRYTKQWKDKNTFIASLEDPVSYIQFDEELPGTTLFFNPDVALSYRRQYGKNYLRWGGIIHPLKYRIDQYNRSIQRLGIGTHLSGLFHHKQSKDNFAFQMSYGQGIAKYFGDITLGGEPDLFLDANGQARLLKASGLTVSYDHWWSNPWNTSLGFSQITIYSKTGRQPQDMHTGQWAFVNLIYNRINFLKIGGEVLYGKRRNLNDESAGQFRIQLTTQVLF